MRTIFQWLRWVCLLLLGLAWTTTSSFAAVGALNQANGGLTIRYDALETQNRGYDAEPLRAWDNNPPEMVDASAFFGSPAQFLAAKTAPNLNNTVYAVEDFLGGQGKIIKNADGDTILMRGDKKIRFDIKDPHGDKPHFHLEQQTPSGKWKDAGPEHRYYFKEDGQ